MMVSPRSLKPMVRGIWGDMMLWIHMGNNQWLRIKGRCKAGDVRRKGLIRASIEEG